MQKSYQIAGVDEAGRGPLAGPVVAAAVILDPSKPIAGLKDSKKLSVKKREILFDLICRDSYSYGIAEASVEEIDQINILQASLLAMRRAVQQLEESPSLILVDGNRCPQLDCEARAIVRGDEHEMCISAASILAKVTRDRQMLAYHKKYPCYGFDQHKGYPTKGHLESLKKYGPTKIHRNSFAPVKKCLISASKQGCY